MILVGKGKLSSAQSLTAGSVASSNVIDIAASGVEAPADAFLEVVTDVAAGGSGAITIDFVLGSNVDMTTGAIPVLRFYTAAITDVRVATAGRKIFSCNIGKQLRQMAKDLGSSYRYVGLYITLGGSVTLTISAALSPTEGPTVKSAQIVDSNVTVPAICSAASGLEDA